MPRDDLSIDFVKRMPQAEVLDPAMILDDWINRVSNLPEEIRFIQDEIADKDRKYNECIKVIEDRDSRIQKWIKANGSHAHNPKEDGYRATVRENYAKADQLAADKIALAQKLQAIMDKHLRQLDMQIKMLYDRNEPGFVDPDEVPSLLRPSAANHSAPSVRSVNPSANPVPTPLNPILNSATPSSAARASANPQARGSQAAQGHAASAPATPAAASMILNRQARESSAGPGSTGGASATKRGPRVNSSLGNLPATSSGLARHSSLGPGTPKAHHQTAVGVQRAGSAGPRSTTKGVGAGPGRKAGTPSSAIGGRKKGTPAASGPGQKSSLSRVKRPAKNSPSSTAESELSEAESASESNGSSRRGTPARGSSSQTTGGGSGTGGGAGAASGDGAAADSQGRRSTSHPPSATAASNTSSSKRETKDKKAAAAAAAADDEDVMDVDDDEAGDDKKYCLCQNVSFGDMVACDNDACPYEWFHWSCVGLKSEPNGTWYCPVCTEKMGSTAARKGK